MEKRVAHYSLDLVKKLILKQKYRITGTAYKDAVSLGFDEEDILETIVRLSPRELYKSMTTYKDVKIWQDVYHIAVHEINYMSSYRSQMMLSSSHLRREIEKLSCMQW